jgi:hypothetical protein
MHNVLHCDALIRSEFLTREREAQKVTSLTQKELFVQNIAHIFTSVSAFVVAIFN